MKNRNVPFPHVPHGPVPLLRVNHSYQLLLDTSINVCRHLQLIVFYKYYHTLHESLSLFCFDFNLTIHLPHYFNKYLHTYGMLHCMPGRPRAERKQEASLIHLYKVWWKIFSDSKESRKKLFLFQLARHVEYHGLNFFQTKTILREQHKFRALTSLNHLWI